MNLATAFAVLAAATSASAAPLNNRDLQDSIACLLGGGGKTTCCASADATDEICSIANCADSSGLKDDENCSCSVLVDFCTGTGAMYAAFAPELTSICAAVQDCCVDGIDNGAFNTCVEESGVDVSGLMGMLGGESGSEAGTTTTDSTTNPETTGATGTAPSAPESTEAATTSSPEAGATTTDSTTDAETTAASVETTTAPEMTTAAPDTTAAPAETTAAPVETTTFTSESMDGGMSMPIDPESFGTDEMSMPAESDIASMDGIQNSEWGAPDETDMPTYMPTDSGMKGGAPASAVTSGAVLFRTTFAVVATTGVMILV